MDLARDFRALADRFRRFSQRPDRAGLKYAEARGGELLILAMEAGLEVPNGFPDLVRVNQQQMAAHVGDREEFRLFCLSGLWAGFVIASGRPNPVVFRSIKQTPEQMAAGIRCKQTEQEDRTTRAENFADMCDELADRVTRIQNSSADTSACNQALSADDDPNDLLDNVCDVLTPSQQRIVRYLWKLKHPIRQERLADNCEMSPEPEAIKQAFKRLSNRLLEKGVNDVYLDSKSAGRVKLVHP